VGVGYSTLEKYRIFKAGLRFFNTKNTKPKTNPKQKNQTESQIRKLYFGFVGWVFWFVVFGFFVCGSRL